MIQTDNVNMANLLQHNHQVIDKMYSDIEN